MHETKAMKAARLRVCMHCEWIYVGDPGRCPLCTWPSYGAHYVCGNAAYRLAKTQARWKERLMERVSLKLDSFIKRKTSKERMTNDNTLFLP